MRYKILTNSDESFELAKCSGRVVKALRLLQVRSSYYADADRHYIAKEQCLHDWIEREEEDGKILEGIKPATLGADAFRAQVALLLFPGVVTAENLDDVDHREAEEALDAFLNFIEPKYRQQRNMLTLLQNYLPGISGNTSPETETGGQ